MPTSTPPPEADSSLASGSQFFRATADNCAREPIHIPGSIQPTGALVTFEPGVGTILHASANLGRWLTLDNVPVEGRAVSDLLGEAAYARVAQTMTELTGGPTRHEVLDLPARPSAGQPLALQALVHSHGGICFIEIEPAAAPATDDWLQGLSDTVDALRSATGLEDLLHRMAQRVKRLTGFDRVMVYRFDADHHGRVVAEARGSGMESFLDLHYPASDIPAQARDLYASNLVHYIADVGYAPVPVLPSPGAERPQPLDMSHAALRSISPLHIQYLKNMGVASTLVMSLMVEGRLWGLIACHHRQPTALPLRLRRACFALSVTAGYVTGWFAAQHRSASSATAASAQARVVEAFNHVQVPLRDVIEHCATPLLQMAGASGGAFWHGDVVQPFGQWPDGPRGESVLRFVHQAFETSGSLQISTEHAELQPPLEPSELRTVCGVMALKFDGFASSGLVWLRPEHRREVLWGGDPDKPVEVQLDADGRPTLAPRSSFARWTSLVHGRSRPWTDIDLEAVASLALLRQVLVVRDSLAQLSLTDRQFRSLVTLQSDAYWQTDRETRVSTMTMSLPFDHPTTQATTLPEVFAGAGHSEGIAELREALAGQRPFRALRVTVRPVDADVPLTFLLSGEPLRDIYGIAAGWHGTLCDITRQAQVEAAMQQKVAAELASLTKSAFLANMSHEIRTPLNAIIGLNDLMLRDATTPKQADRMGKVAAAGQHLLAIVNDILDVSKIEAGLLQLESIDFQLSSVFDQVASVVGGAAHDKGLQLKVDLTAAPRWLRGDATRLRQALLNFASNAVKFTLQGTVTLRARLLDDADGELLLHVSVQDTGIGIGADQLPRLFQDFAQADDSTTRQYGGTGLGLAITRRLALLMGGNAGADSTPGVGSTFWFTARLQRGLGVEPAGADAASASVAVAPALAAQSTDPRTLLRIRHSRARILVVEDNPINRELALSWLEAVGLSADTADDGREGVTRAQQVAYDLILMDMQMPVMDGLTATRAIRALPGHPAMPIVAMTANAFEDSRMACEAAGMSGFITKPTNLDALYSGLLKWLDGDAATPT